MRRHPSQVRTCPPAVTLIHDRYGNSPSFLRQAGTGNLERLTTKNEATNLPNLNQIPRLLRRHRIVDQLRHPHPERLRQAGAFA